MRCIRTCKEIEGLHDKIIITIVTSYVYQNKVTLLLLLALLLMLCTPNNTGDNKLTCDVFGIALYNGDTCNIKHTSYVQQKRRKEESSKFHN